MSGYLEGEQVCCESVHRSGAGTDGEGPTHPFVWLGGNSRRYTGMIGRAIATEDLRHLARAYTASLSRPTTSAAALILGGHVAPPKSRACKDELIVPVAAPQRFFARYIIYSR